MTTIQKPAAYLLTFISVLIFLPATLFSQAKANIRPSLVLQYVKINERGTLQAKLSYSGETGDLPLKGKQISFFDKGNAKLLGDVPTDENGSAICTIEENTKLADEKGSWKFSSEFRGQDTIDAASAEILIKDVTLEMTLSLVDSVKTVALAAYTYEMGKKLPVKGEVVNVFVPRMFSNLKVSDATLDANGTAKIEFPSDIPGDNEGNLPVVARFTEHPAFGTVERRMTEKWGTSSNNSVPMVHRALWTKTPPMWMIITLSVLLIGVWGHYMFAVISLILIKIDSKRKKANDEYKL
jgi:hypothetical protein